MFGRRVIGVTSITRLVAPCRSARGMPAFRQCLYFCLFLFLYHLVQLKLFLHLSPIVNMVLCGRRAKRGSE